MSLLNSFHNIYEGWRNHLFPPKELRQTIEAVSAERLSICRQCIHNSNVAKAMGKMIMRPDEHCIECGCTLAAKTKCLHCACPLDKWKALMSEEDSRTLEEQIK